MVVSVWIEVNLTLEAINERIRGTSRFDGKKCMLKIGFKIATTIRFRSI